MENQFDLNKILIEIIEMVKKICTEAKDFSVSIFKVCKNDWKILIPPQNSSNAFEYFTAAIRYLKNIEYDGVVIVNIVDINSQTIKDKFLVAYYVPKFFEKGTDTFNCIFSSAEPGWSFGENKVGLVEYKEGIVFNIMPLQ